MAKLASPAAMVLGRRIREERQKLGISVMDLGELSSMHFTNLAKIERGETHPNLLTMLRIAGALEVELSDLLKDIGVDHLPERFQEALGVDPAVAAKNRARAAKKRGMAARKKTETADAPRTRRRIKR